MGDVMRVAGTGLLALLPWLAHAAWEPSTFVDPFDDDTIVAAQLATDDIEISVQCREGRTFRVYFYAGQVMDADQRAFGSNHTANALVSPQINARLRFDAAKARNLSFFATDDWRGFYTGQWEAARIVRSFIQARKLVLGIYGIAGDNRVIEVAMPEDTGPLTSVMENCGQKVKGKTWL